jgi:hypothetical protein
MTEPQGWEGFAPEPDDEDLKKFSEEIDELVALNDEIAILDEKLKEMQAQFRAEEERLAERLKGMGMESLTTIDGHKVSLKRDVYANIPKKHQDRAYAWLRANGLDSLIKERTTVSVNANSLRAAVRELLDAGKQPPTDAFNVFEREIVKVVTPK